MTDEHALLAAVLAAPDDDLPRLVYADWCDENGRGERAEFIRAQLRLFRLVEDFDGWRREVQTLARRCHELMRRNKQVWLAPLRPMEPKESGLVGQYATGHHGCVMNVVCSPDADTADHRQAVRVECVGGFVNTVSGPLAALRKCLPALVAANPVAFAEPKDKRPHSFRPNDHVWWRDVDGATHVESRIPRDLMVKAESLGIGEFQGTYYKQTEGCYSDWVFTTRPSAEDALCRLLLAEARARG